MSGELAGTLREAVSIMRQIEDGDALGAAGGDWIEVARVRAALRPARRQAAGSDDGLALLGRWQVTARPCGLREGDRLVGAGLDLVVRHVLRDPALPDRVTADAEEAR